MNSLSDYAIRFFDDLEVFEDIEKGHCYKIFMKQAIIEFLKNETKETAFNVYRTFFDSYRIKMEAQTNPFIDLLDVLKSYEQNASVLIDKQRDHYIHSVNVFILGLAIYTSNKKYQAAFNKANMDKKDYPFSYDTKNEEFFYRWGIASLFHDVGYPVEIVGRQINKFIDFTTEAAGSTQKVNAQLCFENFDEFNSIAEITPKRQFTECYDKRYDNAVYIDMLKPVDLLAHKIHTSLGVDLKQIMFSLNDFVNVMAKCGFIDHGYFSSVIVLKWYAYLIQSVGYKPEYFFFPVLDSASAILLHNCYKNMLMKKPFDLGAMNPETHPIAFLLILCDELQEWNREAYGIKDKLRVLADKADIEINETHLDVTFITHDGSLPENFAIEKTELLYKMLDLSLLFDNVDIKCFSENKSVLTVVNSEIEARPELEDLEKLARAIHELYNAKQLERYPDKPLKYPSFDDLTDSLKYSNLRQAMGITDKLHSMGYIMQPETGEGEAITKIPKDYVEELAKKEHDDWMQERISTGWILAGSVDAEKKQSPYLIKYDELSDDIKQLDRDTIENIPVLISHIGMKIVKKGE